MRRLHTLTAGSCIALLLTLTTGCEGETAAPVDALIGHRGVDRPRCAEDPMTHAEIINACTTATSVQKTPVTPLLRGDGTLPPLP